MFYYSHSKPANDLEPVHTAHATPHDWPVSADETRRAYGYIGHRRATQDMNLWNLPGVKPKLATQGIQPGMTISTWQGIGTVTRVGTIAGFMEIDGRETRWAIDEVIEIIL